MAIWRSIEIFQIPLVLSEIGVFLDSTGSEQVGPSEKEIACENPQCLGLCVIHVTEKLTVWPSHLPMQGETHGN